MIQNLSYQKEIRRSSEFILYQTKPYRSKQCFSSCMAANLNSRKLAVVGKRFLSQINSRSSASLLQRRTVHVSVYDKNSEDHVRPAVIPDELIQVDSEKYWGPHPQTGVFGPITDHLAVGERGFHSLPVGAESVLEQKAFFRPQEDLEKPAHP